MCNVIYKIISKVIANRLIPLLPLIISPEQVGFIEGRNILGGIILVHENMHRKWQLVDWKNICTPKEVGGVSLCDPLDTNKATGAKIWWRWINHEEESWAKLWHMKYAPLWPKKTLVQFGDNVLGSCI